jgi:hypothetical protein
MVTGGACLTVPYRPAHPAFRGSPRLSDLELPNGDMGDRHQGSTS